ncbi:hypothetical protein BGX27_009321 [Mortierella sp. AM989]|nr:hypothetical protein BGX27_009321 [Mortierella sp. AM989]
MDLGPSCFQDALQLVKGFHHLDILSVGDENNYIIHREHLLSDINEYLSFSTKGLRRLFVNVDYKLEKPEIMPGNRCPLLEDYVREVLKPEVESRVISWQREGFRRTLLPAPTTISTFTFSGWLLSYPVTYVLPMMACHKSPSKALSQQELGNDSDDEDENACGRNCLANCELIITNVQLEPSTSVKDLKDHCLMSFSYPLLLSEFCTNATESLCKSLASGGRINDDHDHDDDDDGDDNDVFVDASDVEYRSRSGSAATSIASNPIAPCPAADVEPGCISDSTLPKSSKSSTDQFKTEQDYQPQPQSNSGPTGRSLSRDSIHQQSEALKAKQSKVMDPELPKVSNYYGRVGSILPVPTHEDVFTAGRSFLQQMHNRFQNQNVWKAWEVGQQTVCLPVVGLR